ncbi:MAG: hypothetical protein FWD58_01915 [Firmicutes bacterium]|nr:hypothetical protein [Bacillota bacterium]
MLHDIFEEFCKKSIVAGEDLPDGEYSRHYLFDEESAQRFIAVRSYENQGYVEKHLVDGFKYDSGRLISDSGIYEWLSPDEFNALDKESRKAYVYFEWTNCGDMLNLLKKIFLVADKFKEMHEYECGFKGATDYRIVVKRG